MFAEGLFKAAKLSINAVKLIFTSQQLTDCLLDQSKTAIRELYGHYKNNAEFQKFINSADSGIVQAARFKNPHTAEDKGAHHIEPSARRKP